MFKIKDGNNSYIYTQGFLPFLYLTWVNQTDTTLTKVSIGMLLINLKLDRKDEKL